jgi:hypothetical protein
MRKSHNDLLMLFVTTLIYVCNFLLSTRLMQIICVYVFGILPVTTLGVVFFIFTKRSKIKKNHLVSLAKFLIYIIMGNIIDFLCYLVLIRFRIYGNESFMVAMLILELHLITGFVIYVFLSIMFHFIRRSLK